MLAESFCASWSSIILGLASYTRHFSIGLYLASKSAVDSPLAHDKQSELSRIKLSSVCDLHLTPNQDIVRAKIDYATTCTFNWIDYLSLLITVKNFKASHISVAAVLLVDMNLFNWTVSKFNFHPLISGLAHHRWFLTLTVSHFDTRQIIIAWAPSTEVKLFDSHVFDILSSFKGIELWPDLGVETNGVANNFRFKDWAIVAKYVDSHSPWFLVVRSR